MYRKPDGKYTKSANQYTKAWRRLGKEVGRMTDSTLAGYDGGLLFFRNDGKHESWDCPTDIALKLYKFATGHDFC